MSLETLNVPLVHQNTDSVAIVLMTLFYEDEDQILPLLLHPVDDQAPPCGCRDCVGIRNRMHELKLDTSPSPPLVA